MRLYIPSKTAFESKQRLAFTLHVPNQMIARMIAKLFGLVGVVLTTVICWEVACIPKTFDLFVSRPAFPPGYLFVALWIGTNFLILVAFFLIAVIPLVLFSELIAIAYDKIKAAVIAKLGVDEQDEGTQR